MTTPFYLVMNNPPRRKAKRSTRKAKKRDLVATFKEANAPRFIRTSTAPRRRKRARSTARKEAAPMARRKMTAKQLKYFGPRKSTSTASRPRRAKRRGGFTHGRRGFLDTAGAGQIIKQSAIGAAGMVVGGMVVGKTLAAIGKDKPADHWSKSPTTAAAAKLALALGVFMVGRKVRAVRAYVPAFAAGIGASAGVDGWNLVKDKLPGISGYFTDSEVIDYQPRMAG